MTQDTQERHSPRLTSRVSIVLVVVLVAALLAYVGITHTLASITQPQPTSVHIVRMPGKTPISGFVYVPLDRTITSASQVQDLYQTALGLPGRPPGAGTCLLDPVWYELTFYRASQIILTMEAHTGMCGDVVLDRGNPSDTWDFRIRATTGDFWSELAQILGLPRSDVNPYLH